MKHYVEGKVIIITGGSSGFGLEAARILLEMGARVVISGRDPQRLENARRDLASDSLLAVRGDAVRSDDWRTLIQATRDRFGGVDVLVNNHGAGVKITEVENLSDEEIHTILDINLTSVILGCRAAVQVMKPRGSGHIVNVSSGCASLLLAPVGHLHSRQGRVDRLYALSAQGDGAVGRQGHQFRARRRAHRILRRRRP